MSASSCGPHADVLPRETDIALPAPPALTRDISLQATFKEEFVRLGWIEYAGGTFAWKKRYRGTLIGAGGVVLEFILPPDAITVIPLKDIRAAEIGAKL